MTDTTLIDAAPAPAPRPRALSALEIAAALELPPPTPEQVAVIEADPAQPALVIAGAGSGKTETMAARTLWLVANGHAAPGEILGLTFTRKAAGELAVRMAERVAALRAKGLMPELGEPDPAAELLDAPRVSTYNAFAAAIFRDNAALLGFDGDGVVLGEAASWLLARQIVVDSDDPRLADLDAGVDKVTGAVVAIAAALSENLADPKAVASYADDIRSLTDLPAGGRGAYADVEKDVVERIAALPLLVDLAQQFQRAKFERGYTEFSDQIATAMRIVEANPEVAQTLRDQYRFVILDEYQDTSVSQSRLLSTIFRGEPVMAVGDPHQSIYGWRGASASNLAEFRDWFGCRTQLALSTSWRNGTRILAAANRIIEPLSAQSAVEVKPLAPRPGADEVPITVAFEETLAEEAKAVADWFAGKLRDRSLWKTPKGETEPAPPSAALLLRARANLDAYLEAFKAAGVKYHVLGVGGLLSEPVVADLVAALAVIARADSGSELIRLLVGSRWRLGPRDIVALRALASWLAKRDHTHRPLSDVALQALRSSVAADESLSLVDALDFLVQAPDDHGMVATAGFSEVGLARLREAGELFAQLRRRIRLPLGELTALVIEKLDLDIEVAANESRPGGLRALEAFADAVAGFEQLGASGDVADFLGWLREAQSRERLTPRTEPPEPGCVQVLTIHGSKGLEWDVVAVPRLVEGELPNPSATSTGWLTFGGFPYSFRGDRDALPDFDWRSCETRREVSDGVKRFKEQERERLLLEDRRLAYVAVTRARSHLLLAGSFWASQTKPRDPSRFLQEMAEAGIIDPLPEAPASAERAEGDELPTLPWPRDPLGTRRPRVEAAAEAVRAAEPTVGDPRLALELRLLLEEHRRRVAGGSPSEPPMRVPASRFSDFVNAPDETLAQVRRPMPERPYRATRLGTLFHAWVESRSDESVVGGFDELDDLDFETADELVAVDAERFAKLRETFAASPWADLKPVDVEREIHLPFDGRVVICKIDAVYQHGDRFEVVDWKTGRSPVDAADLERKQLQLALYRLAYASWRGIDPDLIDAAFYFVADDTVIRPERIDTELDLLDRWRTAFPMQGSAPRTA